MINNLDGLVENCLNGNNTQEHKPWQIKSTNNNIHLDYFSAEFNAYFIFMISTNKTFLEFRNIERYIDGPRRQGYGTQILEKIEYCFQKITNRINKDIKLSFTVSKTQEDTSSWLIKQGYKKEDGLYSKMLTT
jgi:hypothetical protein